MRTAANNPSSNQLPKGISEESLIKGIARSGYPVQGLVASQLLSIFHVAEEWGFRDAESGGHRALDLRASLVREPDQSLKIQQLIFLLIECKRSDKPYVFFQSVTDRTPLALRVDGLGGGITLEDTRGHMRLESPMAELLGLADAPWLSNSIPIATSFAIAHPKGKDPLQLSGGKIYNGIVRPLCKGPSWSNRRERPST